MDVPPLNASPAADTRAGAAPEASAVWRFYVPAIVAIAFPLYLFSTNHVLPFTNNFHCDPWHYFGLYYIVDQAKALLDGRAIARLPAIALGHIWTEIFPGILADYANFVVIFSLSSLGVYFTALRLAGPAGAVVAVTFWAFDSIVIGNFSTTFTAPCVLFTVVAIWLACRARTCSPSGRSALLFLCGVFLGSALHGHLYSVVCTAAVPLYAVQWQKLGWRSAIVELITIGVPCATGIFVVTVLFGLVNQLVWNGDFLFFRAQFQAVPTVNFRDYHIEGWFLKGPRGAILCLGLVLAVPQLVLARFGPVRLRHDDPRIVFNIPLAAACLLLIVDTLVGGIFMQYDYYYVFLLPQVALSIGSLFSRVTLRRNLLLGLCVFVVVDAASALPTLETLSRVLASPDDGRFPLAVVAAFALAIVWFGLARRNVLAPAVFALICLAVLGLAIRPQRFGRQLWEAGPRGDPTYGAFNYQRVREGMSYLSAYRFPTRPLFWVAVDDGTWETIAFPRSYYYCIVEMHFPKVEGEAAEFQPGRYIVLAHREGTLVDLANVALANRHLQVEEISRKHIEYRGLSYYLVIGRLAATAGS